MSKKLNREQILRFQKDTQGMNHSQKLEYLMMSESEKEKIVKSIKKTSIQKDTQDKKDVPVKIIKEGLCFEYERKASDAYIT